MTLTCVATMKKGLYTYQLKTYQEDGVVIEHHSILFPFVHEWHRDPVHHRSHDDSSNIEAESNNASIDQEQPLLPTLVEEAPYMDNRLVTKPISSEYFHILDNAIDLRSLCYCKEEYQLPHWYIEHDWSRAAINKL